jgi:hypothetical protein
MTKLYHEIGLVYDYVIRYKYSKRNCHNIQMYLASEFTDIDNDIVQYK